MRKISYAIAASGAALATVAALAPGSAGASTDTPSAPVVVVSGLNNPRALSLVGQNTIFVAEAGKGGTTEIDSDEGPEFVGDSGSISKITDPATAVGQSPDRVITGLLSAAGAPTGEFAVGSDGVAARKVQGPVYIAETYAPPDVLPTPIDNAQSGELLSARPAKNKLKPVANISGYEISHDPDMQGVDSNPYGVLAITHGELVADAAGNDVILVRPSGKRSVFHVFPNVRRGDCKGQADPPGFPGCNFVPTSLASDQNGDIFVGGLVSEVPNAGEVIELNPSGTTVLRVIHGFTSVTGVAVGQDGKVYVSQLEGQEADPVAPGVEGVLSMIPLHGARTNVDVPFPAGVAVDRANNVYVSAWSIASENGFMGLPITGQVWRLQF